MKVINGEGVLRKTAVSMLQLWKWKPSQSRLQTGPVLCFLWSDLESFPKYISTRISPGIFFSSSSLKRSTISQRWVVLFCKRLCVCRNLENDERKCHSLKAVITKQADAGKHIVSQSVCVFTPQNPCSTFLPLGHLRAGNKKKKTAED